MQAPEFEEKHQKFRRTYGPKRHRYNNKHEDNSPIIFNDKNLKVSSQKFRQLRNAMFHLKYLNPYRHLLTGNT